MKKTLKCLLVFVMSVSLAACIDVDQNITLVKDQLTYKAEIKIDEKAAAFSNNKNEKFCDNFYSKSYDGISVEAKESSGGGSIICTVTAQGVISKFNNFSGAGKDKSILITEIDKNKYRIESILDFKGRKNNEDSMQGVVDAMFAGRHVSWSVSAPKILESNGKIAEDRKSVTWSVPMAAAFKTPQNFYAVIQNDSSFFSDVIDFFKKILDSILGVFKSTPPQSVNSQNKSVAAEINTTPVIEPLSNTPNNIPQVATVSPETISIPSTETPQETPIANVASSETQVGNQNFAPSFDCLKSNSGQDRLVCSDKNLSELDVKLSVLYSKARSNTAEKDTLKQEQLQWYKYQRNACADIECLSNAYQSRIFELSQKM